MMPITVTLLDNAKREFEELNEIVGIQLKKGRKNSEEITLFNSIQKKVDLIKKNPFCEDNIPKKLIPKEYNVPNLWRIELSGF